MLGENIDAAFRLAGEARAELDARVFQQRDAGLQLDAARLAKVAVGILSCQRIQAGAVQLDRLPRDLNAARAAFAGGQAHQPGLVAERHVAVADVVDELAPFIIELTQPTFSDCVNRQNVRK